MALRRLIQGTEALTDVMLTMFEGKDFHQTVAAFDKLESTPTRDYRTTVGSTSISKLRQELRLCLENAQKLEDKLVDDILAGYITQFKQLNWDDVEVVHMQEFAYNCNQHHKPGQSSLVAKAFVSGERVITSNNIRPKSLVYSDYSELVTKAGRLKCRSCGSMNLDVSKSGDIVTVYKRQDKARVVDDILRYVGTRVDKSSENIKDQLMKRFSRFGYEQTDEGLFAALRDSKVKTVSIRDLLGSESKIYVNSQEEKLYREDHIPIRRDTKGAKYVKTSFSLSRDTNGNIVRTPIINNGDNDLIKPLEEAIENYIDDPIILLKSRVKDTIADKFVNKGKSRGYSKDLVGIRAILPTVGDCYSFLAFLNYGIDYVHFPGPRGSYSSLFVDYIANPKQNGYKSIQVYGRVDTVTFQERHEISLFDMFMDCFCVHAQIRTNEMDNDAEDNAQAHCVYKRSIREEVEARFTREEDKKRDYIFRALLDPKKVMSDRYAGTNSAIAN